MLTSYAAALRKLHRGREAAPMEKTRVKDIIKTFNKETPGNATLDMNEYPAEASLMTTCAC